MPLLVTQRCGNVVETERIPVLLLTRRLGDGGKDPAGGDVKNKRPVETTLWSLTSEGEGLRDQGEGL